MALSKIVTAESGTTGANVVTGNNIGGSTIDLVQIIGGGSVTVDATAGRQGVGSKSVRFTTAATSDVSLMGLTATDNPSALSMDFYFRCDALPSVSTTICQIRTTGSAATLVLASTGRITVSFTGGSGSLIGSGDPALVAGTVYRLSLGVAAGATGTGDSTVNAGIYPLGSTTPIKTFSITTASLGAVVFTSGRIGKLVAGEAAAAVGWNYDAFRIVTGTSALLAPDPPTNQAPIANAGPDQTVEPWATVTLTGTDTDTENNVTTRSWAQTTGTAVTLSGTGATRTFPAPASIAGSSLTFTYTATDAGALSGSDSMVVTVLPVTERAVIGGAEVPMRVVDA